MLWHAFHFWMSIFVYSEVCFGSNKTTSQLPFHFSCYLACQYTLFGLQLFNTATKILNGHPIPEWKLYGALGFFLWHCCIRYCYEWLFSCWFVCHLKVCILLTSKFLFVWFIYMQNQVKNVGVVERMLSACCEVSLLAAMVQTVFCFLPSVNAGIASWLFLFQLIQSTTFIHLVSTFVHIEQ